MKIPNKIKVPKKIKEEIENLRKTGIPRCSICHTKFTNAKDSITKEISPYLFEPNCACYKKKIMVSIGWSY